MAARDVHAVAVDADVVDAGTLCGVVRARVQRPQERVWVKALGADLDLSPESIPSVKPMRVVPDGDVQAVIAGQQRVHGIASLCLIGP